MSNSRCYSPENLPLTLEIDSPIVNLVDRILAKAIDDGASHIYFEPQAQSLQIGVRQDGLFQIVLQNLPPKMVAPIIAYLKSLAGMKLDAPAPQLGTDYIRDRASLELTALPTQFGDSITAAITHHQQPPPALDRLISQRDSLDRLHQLIRSDRGLVLVVGTAASRQATTVAAMLAEVRQADRKIYALDRTREYAIAGVDPIALAKDADDLTVTNTIQLCLNQQPEIISIGEIFSLSIAQAALNAVDRGCLVFATITADTVGSAIARTIEMGISPARFYSATVGIVAQTSLKRLCGDCRQPDLAQSRELPQLGSTILNLSERTYYCARTLAAEEIDRAKQNDNLCPTCHGAGYRGQIGLYEVLPIGDRLKTTILAGDAEAIDLCAQELGMRSVLDLAIPLLQEGKTTIAELQRCVPPKTLLQNRLAAATQSDLGADFDPDPSDNSAAALHWKQQAIAARQECDRLLAELHNYQQESAAADRRIEHSRAQIEQSTRVEIALQLLSVVDIIELAHASIDPQTPREASIQKGYGMLEQKLLATIKEIGVRVIEAKGHQFNPRLHEIVREVCTDDYPVGMAIAECKRGYTLGDRVLRLAQVKVAVASTYR